jgi:hypothetical protein
LCLWLNERKEENNMTAPTFHVVNALAPVADFYSGGGAAFDTDIISARGHGVLFIIQSGVSAGAAANTITVEACSTITATATTTIPFLYRQCVATDVWSEWTAATATGFSAVNTASNSMFQIWVEPAEIAETGYEFVRLSGDETADHAVIGGILAIVLDPRYGPTTETMLT